MTGPSPNLPVLSLSKLAQGDKVALAELYSTCKDIGFFYLAEHGIAQETLDRILELSRQFFLSASPEEKASLARSEPDHARGYQKLGENITKGKEDAHEAIDLYRSWPPPNITLEEKEKLNGILSGQNPWPSTPAELKPVMEDYIRQLLVVGESLVASMALSLGLEQGSREWNDLVGQVKDSFWVSRLIGYPPLQDNYDGVSCGEHTGQCKRTFPQLNSLISGRLWVCYITSGRLDNRGSPSPTQVRRLDQCGSNSRGFCSEHRRHDGALDKWRMEIHSSPCDL
jgi:isopenicillin N synthase-like dioxygenase